MIGVEDQRWLCEAVALSALCTPSDAAFSVGAIIVDKSGVEIARGFSRESDPHVHAEEGAIKKLAGDDRLCGATIYCSLEPCGQRSSREVTCAQLIIESGITRVVFAKREPSQFVVNPSGRLILQEANIEVVECSSVEPETDGGSFTS